MERGNELVAIYRLFRSLPVDYEMMVNYNLIHLTRENCNDYELVKRNPNMESGKKFCIRFVRLVGILSTFQSVEAFDEVWSSVAGSIEEFLTSKNTTELDVLQVISIIVFTVHLHKRLPVELELHFVLLQKYAVLVAYEFGARLLQICASVNDVFSTPLLPGLLVFIEWVFYSPDINIEEVKSNVINQDLEERVTRARWFFWRSCLVFLRNTVAGRNMQGHDDISSSYKNKNELVIPVELWEDRELQGYIPIVPVHRSLKLSRPDSFRGDEKQMRMARITDAIRKFLGPINEGPQLEDNVYLERAYSDQSGIIRDEMSSFRNKHAVHAEKNIVEQLNSGVTYKTNAEGRIDDITEADMDKAAMSSPIRSVDKAKGMWVRKDQI